MKPTANKSSRPASTLDRIVAAAFPSPRELYKLLAREACLAGEVAALRAAIGVVSRRYANNDWRRG